MKKIDVLGYNFEFICKYSDCYNENRNNFSKLNDNILCNQKGLYLFYDDNNKEYLYVGSVTERSIAERVKQHFNLNDSGGILIGLKKDKIEKMQSSSLYVCAIKGSKRDILFAEALVIGATKPSFNFL